MLGPSNTIRIWGCFPSLSLYQLAFNSHTLSQWHIFSLPSSAWHCPYRWARDSPWRWPWPEAMPVHYWEGSSCCLQGSVWPPRLPWGHPAQAQYGYRWTLLLSQVQQPGDCNGHCYRPAPHCAPCSHWWVGYTHFLTCTFADFANASIY